MACVACPTLVAGIFTLDVPDFCHAIRASDGDGLYVFCGRHTGYDATIGDSGLWVYVKHRLVLSDSPYDYVFALHELKYPIDLLFED